MSETTNKFVRYFRIGIYTAMALSFLGAMVWDELCAAPAIEAVDPERESDEFWPPDMIPHPTLPERAKESDMA